MIVLRAKQIPFEVTYIDLTDKPDWFLAISPHGKVPVLRVDDVPLFESNAIAEYLEEAEAPRLHPEDLLARARNRPAPVSVAQPVRRLHCPRPELR